jgi:hypothetical protein
MDLGVGKMPMEDIKFVGGHGVDDPLYRRRGNEVPRGVQKKSYE